MSDKGPINIRFVLGSQASDEARDFAQAIKAKLEKETAFTYRFVDAEASAEIFIILGLDQEHYEWLRAMIENLEFGSYAIFYHPDFAPAELFDLSALEADHKGRNLIHAFYSAKWLRQVLPGVCRYLERYEANDLPEAESPPV
ncbi:hypothetical protein H6761_03240 [Candidatus Nomurabacteria bacterium]|nr:hypothetical protein [Candidatus Nomurabacteria bacterium]